MDSVVILRLVIPRVFHQVWLGPYPFPAEFEQWQQTWQANHPDWELRLWTDENLPGDLRNPAVYERERRPVERADIARLEVLYAYGGVYLDADMECLRPIDPLIEGHDFFAACIKDRRVTNTVIGSTPGHSILDQALSELRPMEPGERFDKRKSGPLLLDEIVSRFYNVHKIPRAVFFPETDEERESAYAVHHAARTWKESEDWRDVALRHEDRLERARRALDEERRAHQQTMDALAEANKLIRHKILFFLRSIHYDRVFENFMRELLERGHEVHVALALEKRGLSADKTKIFDSFRERYAFSYERLPERTDRWLVPAVALRHALDYLRYLEPEFDGADPLRERARERAPKFVRALLATPGLRGRRGRKVIGRLLRRLEAAVPIPREIKRVIADNRPDVVLVSPLVGLGSIESDYVRAAQDLGVPTVLVVASWDNLTNKGVIRDAPTMTIVWNETQVKEAVRLHRIPPGQVAAVGAHSFDHWFSWQPSTTREQFAQAHGLDPERPLVLYLGSSFFIAGDETGFIRDWLGRLREHPRLRDAAVVLRPHPQNVVGWAELDVDEPGKTVVWPRWGEAPTSERQKVDYFDTLHHSAAMVGINTTALIEAAILRRPVLTLVNDSFDTQEGTLHFSYIAEDLVTVGRTWEEHFDQLADAIENPHGYEQRSERFLAHFVRPHGLDTPAAPAAVDAVERAALIHVEPARRAPLLRPLLVALTPVVWVAVPLFHPRESWQRLVKATRKWVGRRRKDLSRRRSGKPKRPLAVPAGGGRSADLEREAARKLKEEQRALKLQAKGKVKGEGKTKVKGEKVRAKGKARPAGIGARSRRLARTAGKRLRRMGPVSRRRWKRTKRAVRVVYNMRFRHTYETTIDKVPSRDELPILLNKRDLTGRGAEIGVKTGKYSEQLLKSWKGEQLLSIDPWLSADPDEYVDRSNVSQDEFEGYYRETRERLAPFAERSKIWRRTSLEAAALIPDGSLDFAYIDARHDYESVKEDVAAWFPKVKPGGILAGHDYVDGMLPQGDFGVKSAVDEFFAERGLSVHGTEGPSAVELFPSWIVEIPAEGKSHGAESERSVAAG